MRLPECQPDWQDIVLEIRRFSPLPGLPVAQIDMRQTAVAGDHGVAVQALARHIQYIQAERVEQFAQLALKRECQAQRVLVIGWNLQMPVIGKNCTDRQVLLRRALQLQERLPELANQWIDDVAQVFGLCLWPVNMAIMVQTQKIQGDQVG